MRPKCLVAAVPRVTVVVACGGAIIGCGGSVTAPNDEPDAAEGGSVVEPDAADGATYVAFPDGALVLTGCPGQIEIQVRVPSIPSGTCPNWPPPPTCDTCTSPMNCYFTVSLKCPGGELSTIDWLCGCAAANWDCHRVGQGFMAECPRDEGGTR
jgi:hypothetical protein